MIFKDREWYTKTERQSIKFNDRETENDIQRQRDRELNSKTERQRMIYKDRETENDI